MNVKIWMWTYECVKCVTWLIHMWISHVTRINESCHTYEWVMSHRWVSHVTHINEWVMSHISMSHVTHMQRGVTDVNQSRHPYSRVLLPMQMRQVTCINENVTCHLYERVVSHIWISHVTHEVLHHTELLRLSRMSHVARTKGSRCMYKRGTLM